MVTSEFKAAMKRLEDTYGPMSEPQIALIIPAAIKLDVQDFNQVIDDLILEGRKPWPKTVVRLCGEAYDKACQRRAKANRTNLTEPLEPGFSCQICKDGGFVMHGQASKDSSMTIFAGCLCEKGSDEFGYQIKEANEAKPIPPGFLKPQGNIWEKIQEWNGFKSVSRSYWENCLASQQDLPFE